MAIKFTSGVGSIVLDSFIREGDTVFSSAVWDDPAIYNVRWSASLC